MAMVLLDYEGESAVDSMARQVSFSEVVVAGVNHSGPLDVELSWQTKDNQLKLIGWRLDAGGGQTDVAKVFRNREQPFGLVAISGKTDGPINQRWFADLRDPHIVASFIPLADDTRVNVNNIIDGDPMELMMGWGAPIPAEIFTEVANQTMHMLSQMLEDRTEPVWLHITAGGGIRYADHSTPYGTLLKQIKETYADRVQLKEGGQAAF